MTLRLHSSETVVLPFQLQLFLEIKFKIMRYYTVVSIVILSLSGNIDCAALPCKSASPKSKLTGRVRELGPLSSSNLQKNQPVKMQASIPSNPIHPVVQSVSHAPAQQKSTPVQTQRTTVAVAKPAPAPITYAKASAQNPPPAPVAGTSSGDVPALFKSLLDFHNSKRALHSAGPLTWSPQLAVQSQSHVNQCQFVHSGTVGCGENMAETSSMSVSAAGNMWYNEASLFDYNNGGFSSATGHFTQMVWKGTTKIGCAMATCPGQTYGAPNWSFVTCQYQAQGNVLGQFRVNVSPPA